MTEFGHLEYDENYGIPEQADSAGGEGTGPEFSFAPEGNGDREAESEPPKVLYDLGAHDDNPMVAETVYDSAGETADEASTPFLVPTQPFDSTQSWGVEQYCSEQSDSQERTSTATVIGTSIDLALQAFSDFTDIIPAPDSPGNIEQHLELSAETPQGTVRFSVSSSNTLAASFFTGDGEPVGSGYRYSRDAHGGMRRLEVGSQAVADEHIVGHEEARYIASLVADAEPTVVTYEELVNLAARQTENREKPAESLPGAYLTHAGQSLTRYIEDAMQRNGGQPIDTFSASNTHGSIRVFAYVDRDEQGLPFTRARIGHSRPITTVEQMAGLIGREAYELTEDQQTGYHHRQITYEAFGGQEGQLFINTSEVITGLRPDALGENGVVHQSRTSGPIPGDMLDARGVRNFIRPRKPRIAQDDMIG